MLFSQKKIAALSETVESEEVAEAQTLEMTPSKRSQRGSESRRGKEAARFYPVTKEPGQHGDKESDKRKRKTSHSDNPPVENHVGWIMDKKAARERLESVTESLGESPECSGDDRGSSAGTTPQVFITFKVQSNQQIKQFTFSVFTRLPSPEPQSSQGKRIYPTSVHQVSLQMP